MKRKLNCKFLYIKHIEERDKEGSGKEQGGKGREPRLSFKTKQKNRTVKIYTLMH